MLKIAIISPKAYPVFNTEIDATFGGAEIALSRIAKQIVLHQECDIKILVGDYGQPNNEKRDGVQLVKALDNSKHNIMSAFFLLNKMRSVNADIYIQRSLSLASPILALYVLLMRKKFIYWVAHDHETDGGHNIFKTVLGRGLLYLLYTYATHVIVQNKYEDHELKKRYPKVKTTLLKKGIQLLDLKERPKQNYDAIWVGRCDEWKRPELFIKISKKFPEYRFLMICPPALGKDDYYKKIRNMSSSCENLKHEDRKKNKEVLNLLSHSRLFCMTSTQEGDWPNVVLEAASMATPILSLYLNYDGLIDNYEGGVFCDGNWNVFVSSFESLISNREQRNICGRGALRYVVDHHSLETQTTKLIQLLKSL